MELELYSNKSDKIEEIVSSINRKFSSHEVVKKIADISSPVFLGLDRRKEKDDKEHFYFEREVYLRRHNKNAMAAKRLIKGSLGVSLMETEILVQNAYRRLREVEERRSGKLRDSILLSAFQYTRFDVDDFVLEKSEWKEKAGLLQRQKEIKEALGKIGVRDSRLSTQVDNFFHQLTSLFEELSSSDKDLNIEWLLNKAQIDRMSRIVEIIDEHKSYIDDLFEPVNRFVSMMNDFYRDSNKEIEVDAVGQLLVKRPDGIKTTVEGLSSGERQLLVLFAHAFFATGFRRRKNSVYIIDEPELSLHLRWQEKFADSIFSVSPGSQFILATHSPEIVGVNKNKAIGCR